MSCSEGADLAEDAVASTKSMIVGSEAPVRRRRVSETKVLWSILVDCLGRSGWDQDVYVMDVTESSASIHIMKLFGTVNISDSRETTEES